MEVASSVVTTTILPPWHAQEDAAGLGVSLELKIGIIYRNRPSHAPMHFVPIGVAPGGARTPSGRGLRVSMGKVGELASSRP